MYIGVGLVGNDAVKQDITLHELDNQGTACLFLFSFFLAVTTVVIELIILCGVEDPNSAQRE